MRSRQLLSTAAVAVVLAALTGCGGAGQADDPAAAAPEVIRLGTLVPLSGRNSPSGKAMVAAAQLAVDEANAAGGVLG
nr:hypothetical protein GCM10020092_048980 [Actinoplanes digitatis]